MIRDKAPNRLRGVVIGIALLIPQAVLADEGGVSFWVPGLFGSLVAVPQQQPGWSAATFYYHTSVSAGGNAALAREFAARRIPANLTASLNANLNASADIQVFAPTYAFATPILGSQASVTMLGSFGRSSANVTGTLSGSLAVGGISIPFSCTTCTNPAAVAVSDDLQIR